jgi:hypothetical protein
MDICTETSCREWPALKLTQSTRADLSVTLRDASGEPLEISPDTHSVELTVKEWESGATTYFARECTISETQEGMVSLRVNSSDIPYAGTWVGEFTVTKNVSDSSEEEPEFEPFVEYRLRCYVE